MKIVINDCHGGFGLSEEAMKRYAELTEGVEYVGDGYWKKDGIDFGYYQLDRNDPTLVRVVEELGDAASGKYAELKVVDIPDDVKWTIEEYDGTECVAEVHRIWS